MTDRPLKITVSGGPGQGRTTLIRVLEVALQYLNLPVELDESVTRDGDYPAESGRRGHRDALIQTARLAWLSSQDEPIEIHDVRTPLRSIKAASLARTELANMAARIRLGFELPDGMTGDDAKEQLTTLVKFARSVTGFEGYPVVSAAREGWPQI